MAQKQHPIQVVVRRTGLSADVLRAWERRYGVVEPARSATGRRLYSDDDIERLRLLRRATSSGRSIGQISGLSTEELTRLVRDDETEEARVPEAKPGPADGAEDLMVDALDAAEDMDAARLERVLARGIGLFGAERMLEAVAAPVLTEIGERWTTGELSIAHEHLASAVIRQVVGDLLGTSSADPDRPLILCATPAGERHEFGALMAAVIAATLGWRVLYLGADLPAEDLARAVSRHRPRLVALSVVSRDAAAQLGVELRRLRGALPADTTLLVGGRGIKRVAKTLEQEGAVHLDSLAALRAYLAAGGSPSDRG